MIQFHNEPRHKGRHISRIRAMFEHRAEWLYLILDEARKQGLSWATFAPHAIYRCGAFHGDSLVGSVAKAEGLVALRRKLFSGMARSVFEMEILHSDANELRVEFHYCPLVSAWKKLGASDAEIGELCDIAMRGDAGIAESFGAHLELGDVIAKGGDVCRLRFISKGAQAPIGG